MTATSIFLYGTGGHARSVFEVLHRQGEYEVTAVLDDAADPGARFRGLSVLGGREALPTLAEQGPHQGFVAVGNNRQRREIVGLAAAEGLTFALAVDPSAVVARDVSLGRGTVVMPRVVVSTGSIVGGHVILNTGCTVDHDCQVGDFAHLSPGANVSGECVIGAASHLGIGCSVIQRISIGEAALVGAGAAVVKDVPPGAVFAGVPARLLHEPGALR
jgi:acetyltransferase EpsM